MHKWITSLFVLIPLIITCLSTVNASAETEGEPSPPPYRKPFTSASEDVERWVQPPGFLECVLALEQFCNNYTPYVFPVLPGVSLSVEQKSFFRRVLPRYMTLMGVIDYDPTHFDKGFLISSPTPVTLNQKTFKTHLENILKMRPSVTYVVQVTDPNTNTLTPQQVTIQWQSRHLNASFEEDARKKLLEILLTIKPFVGYEDTPKESSCILQ